MNTFPIALMISTRNAGDLAHSALPDAPVVPDPEPRTGTVRRRRTRVALATALHRLAEDVAPRPERAAPRVAECSPAH